MSGQSLSNSMNVILRNPKKRNIALMAVLIFITLVLLIVIWMLYPEPSPPGALRVVMCLKCNKQYVERVTDINDSKYKCKYCGGKLGFAQKCHECAFEFTNLPTRQASSRDMSTMDRFRREADAHKCPNCQSPVCGYISVNDFENKEK